jgi:hypothetical protein
MGAGVNYRTLLSVVVKADVLMSKSGGQKACLTSKVLSPSSHARIPTKSELVLVPTSDTAGAG